MGSVSMIETTRTTRRRDSKVFRRMVRRMDTREKANPPSLSQGGIPVVVAKLSALWLRVPRNIFDFYNHVLG